MADASPIPAQKDVVYFGRANFRNENRLFGVKRRDRRQHMYVIGKTGTGKTSLIHNMIVQDVANGEGLCVVDPHGELIEEITREIPVERLKDVIYFNPADPEYHIGFNVLEVPDPRYKHLVASGLMSIFTKIWANVWSARMEYIMNNAILALIDTPGSTLLGIIRILVDKEFRQRIVGNIKDPVVRAFWVHEYEEWQDKFRNEAIAPIQNKVGQFLSTALIRNVVGQSKSTIDIADIMNTQKIFLVNVSKGRIGEDNSALLGAMLITKIQLSAMERVRIPEDERKDFYLYVDEFQNFATDSFASILSEARKYRLNLVLAHQYIGQLVTENASTKVRDAVFGNVGTMVSFRVGATDAEFLEKEFEPEFTPPDIIQLPNHHIYLKLMVDGVTSRPFSASTLRPFHLQTVSDIEQQVVESSRKLYARSRRTVEEEINRWSGMNLTGGDDGGERGGGRRDQQFRPRPRSEGQAPSDAGPAEAPSPRQSGASPRRVEMQYAGQLAELGIEFDQSVVSGQANSPRSAPRSDRKPQFQGGDTRRKPDTRDSRDSRGPRNQQPVKLSELRPQKSQGKTEPNRNALRDALKAAIGGATNNETSTKKTDSV